MVAADASTIRFGLRASHVQRAALPDQILFGLFLPGAELGWQRLCTDCVNVASGKCMSSIWIDLQAPTCCCLTVATCWVRALSLYHVLGRLPEPKLAHKFF